MVGQGEEAVLRGGLHVGHPVLRHADGQKVLGRQPAEQRRGRRGRGGAEQVLDALPDFPDLHRAGAGMRLDAAPFRPGVGVIMVADIGEQETGFGLMHDHAQVAADADRPEIRVTRAPEPVELQTRRALIQLHVESGGLRGFLLIALQPGQGGDEGIGDAELDLGH